MLPFLGKFKLFSLFWAVSFFTAPMSGAVSSLVARTLSQKNKQKLVVGAIFVYLGRRLEPPRKAKINKKTLTCRFLFMLGPIMAGK